MTASAPKKRLCVAFASMGGEYWTAGTHYLKNLFAALRSLTAEEQVEIVLLTPDSDAPESLKPYVDRVLFTTGIRGGPGFWERQWNRFERRIGIDPEPKSALSAFLRDQDVDVLFSNTEYGPRFDVPLLSWIPDFQHRHLPEMFSPAELESRYQTLSRIAKYASRVILSSQNARHDLEAFAPDCVPKARVLPFVAQIPSRVYDSDPAWICDRYHLPQRFLYLPNQFATHKNHTLVVEALSSIKEQRPEVVVVCTGNTNETRHPLHFAQLMAQIAERGLRDRFIVLGLVPHDHTFILMRQSMAVLQPSLFEGWSTTIEEAKSLGKSVVLSDLAVHREQNAPAALYFNPRDPDALVQRLEQVFDQSKPGPALELEAKARMQLSERVQQFGRSFLNIVSDLGIAPSR